MDPLINGKNNTGNIVSIEVKDDVAELFIENPEDNSITIETVPNKRWVLSNYAHGKNWVKLQGNLHYKYGCQFTTKEDFNKSLSFLRKKNVDTYQIYDDKESCMVNKGITYFKGMKNTDPSILSFDIESTGLYHNNNSKVLLISNTLRKKSGILRKLFAYDDYESQAEMIDDWCNWVRENDPSIICGHNIYTYDFPYLNFVAKASGTSLNLGRDDSDIYIANKPSQFRIDGSRSQEYHKVRIYGREVIDTMYLAVKYDVATKKYESYGLKSIIKTEGLEKTDRVMYDAGQIRFKYKDPIEWEKIKAYCEHDADDALALYDLMSPSLFYMTQMVPKSFQSMIETATGSQINSIMVRSYLQEGHSIPKANEAMPYEGAISFGEPGIFRNVYKVDVASLYPSIMIECEVYDVDKDPKGNFLRLVRTLTEERLKNKALAKTSKYHDDLQSSQKITINSCYGFLGTPGLQFNSPTAAEFITKTGRDILQTAIEWARGKGFFVVNADTDSISFNHSEGKDLSKEERDVLLKDLNSQFPKRISWEDDGYYRTICVLKAKNYIMDDGKKVKYKGSAIKASTKPPALKEFIKRMIGSILEGKTDYTEIYTSYIKEVGNITDIKRWATRKTISDKVLESERTNEAKVRDAIEGTEIVEGDRIWVYYKEDNSLSLIEKFDGNYNKERLLKNVYDTAKIFDTVLDCKELFPNYALKKNKAKLEELLNG